ncbi:resolvase [Pseudomonas kribbensis]|uniref:Resolvase n=1 Tax=Pseudomonas kribbensis TaxID=1628086 RepID=A0A345RL58_9PSED|nr:helix-turn-helix transcriptional regulator [Pseudomonas kribbensis]AXI60024.1 resolvase [Pseudomonas kribbensis]
MSLTKELAAAIRVIRRQRGLGYEDLADVSVQAHIGALEQGNASPSLDKLVSLAEALDFDPVALMAICVALRDGSTCDQALEHAQTQLADFKHRGGIKQLEGEYVGNELVKRSPGKPTHSENAEAVKKLKSDGFSQAEVRRTLGLSKSTVHRYWQKD